MAFENVHGQVFLTAEYAVAPVLRDRALQLFGNTYEQVGQTVGGMWRYRAMQGVTHGALNDGALNAFLNPSDPGWDGPPDPIPADLTFPRLLAFCDQLISEQRPVTLDTVRDLRARILAAYRGLGYGG